jgi:hypothetical protein
MFNTRITAIGAALAVAIAAPGALAHSAPSPGAMGAGATAVSSQSLIPQTPSPGALGGGATAVESQSLIPGYYRTGEHSTVARAGASRAAGFDWGDAGMGAGTAVLLALAGVGSVLVVTRRRSLAG